MIMGCGSSAPPPPTEVPPRAERYAQPLTSTGPEQPAFSTLLVQPPLSTPPAQSALSTGPPRLVQAEAAPVDSPLMHPHKSTQSLGAQHTASTLSSKSSPHLPPKRWSEASAVASTDIGDGETQAPCTASENVNSGCDLPRLPSGPDHLTEGSNPPRDEHAPSVDNSTARSSALSVGNLRMLNESLRNSDGRIWS